MSKTHQIREHLREHPTVPNKILAKKFGCSPTLVASVKKATAASSSSNGSIDMLIHDLTIIRNIGVDRVRSLLEIVG